MVHVAFNICLMCVLVTGIGCGPNWMPIGIDTTRVIGSATFAADHPSIGGGIKRIIPPAYEKVWSDRQYSYRVGFRANFRDGVRRNCYAQVRWIFADTGLIRILEWYFCIPPWPLPYQGHSSQSINAAGIIAVYWTALLLYTSNVVYPTIDHR